jgi:hypothetical protein
MKNSSTADDLLWTERQRAGKALADIERRKWVRDFALMATLAIVAIAVASLLASLHASGTIRAQAAGGTPLLDRALSLDAGRSLGRSPSPSQPAAQRITAEWAERMDRLARLVHNG